MAMSVDLANEYLREVKLSWATKPTLCNTVTADGAMIRMNAAERTIKALALASGTPFSNTHKVVGVLEQLPCDQRLKDGFHWVAQQVEQLRSGVPYPGDPAYIFHTRHTDMGYWDRFERDCEALMSLGEAVIDYEQGGGSHPPGWR